tara:strand:+ start:1185 stop:1388 length:204 start_codon:yes stop_codon:yes gene_type:complete
MAYNQSFRMAREQTRITDQATTSRISPSFRATKNGNTVMLDFGSGMPRIEMTIDGDNIEAKFVVADS